MARRLQSRTEGQGLEAVLTLHPFGTWGRACDCGETIRAGAGGEGPPGPKGGHGQLCLPTATGALHKAVVSEDGRVHLVEEIQLFPRPEPVLNLQLAPTQVRRGLQRRWAGAAGSGAGTREHGTLRLSSRAQCLQASQAAS